MRSWAPVIILVSTQCGASSAAKAREAAFLHLEEFAAAYGRTYQRGSDEYELRSAFFEKRRQLIEAQNSKPHRLWTAGFSSFTDRTEEELRQFRGWRRVAGGAHRGGSAALLEEHAQTWHSTAAEIDWRALSLAHEVPDQRECGSCWAVATATMLAGRLEVQSRVNRSFSVQQLVDCVPNPQGCGGSGGCDGATVELAMHYVESMGLEDEIKTPYTARQGSCRLPTSTSIGSAVSSFLDRRLRGASSGERSSSIGLQTWYKLPENRALPLMHAASQGPVAISVAASDWFLYNRGVFDGCTKDVVIDHAVVLFGYGKSSDGVNYWTIRNSWGKDWGEGGFIRVLRHNTHEEDDQHCGVDHDPKSGVACKPYPKSVEVCGMCGLLYDSVVANFVGSQR